MKKRLFLLTAILVFTSICTECPAKKDESLGRKTRGRKLFTVGEFQRIYTPSPEQENKWHINDHCFVLEANGTWHLYGITDEKPESFKDETQAIFLAHATAPSLLHRQWNKQAAVLQADPSRREAHLWAPHVILHEGVYYLYYCAGDPDHSKYQICLATSTDLYHWQRHPDNPMVVDGYDARDPFILRIGDQWVMYYTATSEPEGGHHVVAAVTSTDLIHWSDKRVVYTDPEKGTWGGPTESPFVVRRGPFYYLFIGPGADYVTTKVYRSLDPFAWSAKQHVATVKAHASEIVRDTDGRWYISHCGIDRGGVWLAPLEWNDGVDDKDTSVPVPTVTLLSRP